MELAQALKPLRVRPITGAELTMEDGSHLTLLCETRRGLPQPVPADHRGARRHAAERREPTRCRPVTAYEALERHAEGLVCLSGCARHGAAGPRGRGGPPRRGGRGRPAAAAGSSDPIACGSSCSAPSRATTAAATGCWPSWPSGSGCPTVATGNVHAHSRARTRLQDALVAVRLGRTLDECEPWRRGNSSHALAPPEAMAARFAEHPEAVDESARLAERLRST